MKLENKIIFITGATKGIGLALAKQLLAKNNTVIIGARNQKVLDLISIEFENINTLYFDVLNNESLSSISRIIEQEYGRLDVLINNAAVLNAGNFNEIDYSFEKIETEILTNIASPIGNTGQTDHPFPEQIDHPFVWRKSVQIVWRRIAVHC